MILQSCSKSAERSKRTARGRSTRHCHLFEQTARIQDRVVLVTLKYIDTVNMRSLFRTRIRLSEDELQPRQRSSRVVPTAAHATDVKLGAWARLRVAAGAPAVQTSISCDQRSG